MKRVLQRASDNSREGGTDYRPVPPGASPTGAGRSPALRLLPTLFQSWFGAAALAVIILLQSGNPVRAADSLVWRRDKNLVGADNGLWALSEMVESISTATGWENFVEAGMEFTLPTTVPKFRPG